LLGKENQPIEEVKLNRNVIEALCDEKKQVDILINNIQNELNDKLQHSNTQSSIKSNTGRPFDSRGDNYKQRSSCPIAAQRLMRQLIDL
jgi:membrane-anchored protein YejM (alkaline phosphatase superfamily)